MTSIHDHRIRELTIQVIERQLRLRTAFPEMIGPEFAEVIFEGIETYLFNGDEITSSIGLDGVVWARKLTIRAVQPQAGFKGDHGPLSLEP